MEEYKIRLLEIKDCQEAAALRFAEHNTGFLSSMSLEFHAEILKGTCKSKWGFGLVCVGENEKIIGMLYAATNLKKYYRSILLRKWPMLAWRASLTLIKRPMLIRGVVQYFFYPARTSSDSVEAEWLTMVVDRNYRGKGIAKALTKSLIEEYKKRGTKKFRSTVAANNIISCRLHEKYGFKLTDSFELCGNQINVYHYYLKQ